ncbi:unnamed protein product [Caenorhabditis auriculariae]|uniref:Uncharacterized protein n=1 Tax=Caenorhabditis auriculariae TaxID=2777116 RepID=A0A8S1HMP0_9PELO|nr:unnamed protein product [Caenorhabditis auriculariae]
MTELEPYKPICLDHQWHEIEHACRNYYNSSSRCDLSAEEDKQLLKELQTCCEDEENCWPREMDEYCCQEEPCNNHKCKIPMPAKGTSVVSEAILKKMLQQEEEREGDGIFSKKILTRKQKKLIVKLHNFLNTKNSTVVREIINDLTLIIYNNEVIRPPITLTSFLDLSTVKEHRIHFLIDVVEQLSEEWHAAVDFTGFMCTSLPTCSELQATFRWNIKKKDYFVSKFKNNKSNVKPSIDEYPYWAGEE